MDRLFWFSLLLTYLPVTESMKKEESCLSQPHKISRKAGHNAVLHCNVSSTCSAEGLNYEWFAFKESSHFRLNPDNSSKYSLNGASLHIKSLHINDSGIYHCAAVSSGDPVEGAQHVGMGTTLVVREQNKIRCILLWLSFVLLAIYSLAVVTLIIKKYGCNMSICRRPLKTDKVVDKCLIFCFSLCLMCLLNGGKANRSKKRNRNQGLCKLLARRGSYNTTNYKNNSTKKTQFRAVLQEMYSRRNVNRSKETASRNRSQAEAASNEFNGSVDDIYQNV